MIKTARMQRIEQERGRVIEAVLADLYIARGLTIREVAAELHVHPTLVPKYLRLCGLPVRPVGGARAQRPRKERVL